MNNELKDQSWKVKIVNQRFPLNKTNNNISNNILADTTVLFKYPQHSKICKYTTFKKYTKESLKNDTLWLSFSHKLNDPFECQLNLATNEDSLNKSIQPGPNCVFDKTINKIDEDSPEYLLKYRCLKNLYRKKLKSSFDKIKHKIAICSLTERHDSLLMWAHYTNNHTGFCVEYNFCKLINYNNYCRNIFPVIYDENIVDLTFTKDIDDIQSYVRNKSVQAFVTKSVDWSYEREWRLLTIVDEKKINTSENGFNIKIIKPTTVYLGCKMKDDERTELIHICKEKNIEVYQMVKNPSKYELNPCNIESCRKNTSLNEWELDY